MICNIFIASRFYLLHQVHIADGIQFIRDITSSASANVVSVPGNEDTSSNESCTTSQEEDTINTKVDIIIIDVDSADSR